MITPLLRLSQKPLKRREPQRHGDTKFFFGPAQATPGRQKRLPLWFNAFLLFATAFLVGLAKDSEKKGTTKSTKRSFSFPSWPACSSWFKAFMTPSRK